MQLKLFSAVGLVAVLMFTSGMIFAQIEEDPSSDKSAFSECLREAKYERKTSIQDARDLYKSEKERLNRPEYRPALREAKMNMKNDIRAAKDDFKDAKKDCKTLRENG